MANEQNELTVIARGMKLHGKVEAHAEVHFFGQLFGELKAHPGSTVYVKEGALIDGRIEAENLVVEGFVTGEIICSQKIWVTSLGKIAGTLQTPSMQIDPGAVFEARVKMG
jgi:cytoskeletal protein CcmA (bactofilin family)